MGKNHFWLKEDVTLNGSIIETDSKCPLNITNMPVKISFSTLTANFTVQALSDPNGFFNYTFRPPTNLVGLVGISSVKPGIEEFHDAQVSLSYGGFEVERNVFLEATFEHEFYKLYNNFTMINVTGSLQTESVDVIYDKLNAAKRSIYMNISKVHPLSKITEAGFP